MLARSYAPRLLVPDDAVPLLRLRSRMLAAAPWAFSVNAGEGSALDVERVAEMLAEKNHATLAIDEHGDGTLDPDRRRATGALLGTASITRARQRKFAHRARLWGVFVEPAQRQRGLGKALIGASVERARSWGVEFVDLSVSARSPEAERLYRAAGFTPWGREPEATAWNGERYDEIHMALRL